MVRSIPVILDTKKYTFNILKKDFAVNGTLYCAVLYCTIHCAVLVKT